MSTDAVPALDRETLLATARERAGLADYGDTWFELGLGGNVRISRTGNFYGEVTRGFGGDINKKWSVNAGLRFTF